jgi:hypothetical protein
VKTSFIFFCCIGFTIFSCQQSHKEEFSDFFQVTITNTLDKSRKEVAIQIPETQIVSVVRNFNPLGFVVVDNGKEIPSQFNKNDTSSTGIVFVLDSLGGMEKRTIEIRYNPSGAYPRNYEKKTQAELSHKSGGEWKGREYIGGEFKNVSYLKIPPEHKDHSWYIRYEGPGWESDKVGYRFYLDQRNAVDVFGKKVSTPVLQKIGNDNFDSYHEMQPWGMDIMKVGKSLGVGSIGYFSNGIAMRVEKTDSISCRILENGTMYSSFLTNYSGWAIDDKKHDLIVTTSIHAGSRLTSQLIAISNSPDNICTGIVKDSLATLLFEPGDKNRFGYLATYGNQSLNGDDLGLAVFFDPAIFIEATNDEYSHIVKLKPLHGVLQYYFLAAWVKEPGGIKNKNEFEDYIKNTALELAHPVEVEIKKL